MTAPKLLVFIGLPGSGKTTLAQFLKANAPIAGIVSTDAIRAALFGHEATQGPWLQVWAEVERQFRHWASSDLGQSSGLTGLSVPYVIYDATNAKRRDRRRVIALGRLVGFSAIYGLWLDAPLALCQARNQARERQVPDDVIEAMGRSLTQAPPHWRDGFDGVARLPVEATVYSRHIQASNPADAP